MPVKVENYGSEVWFDLQETVGCEFFLKHESDRQIGIKIPIELDDSFKDKDFDVYFLAKKNIKESDVFQVYCRESDRRLGWIIPTLALGSSLHNFSENEHFLKYAYVGIRESLKKNDSRIFSNCIPGEVDEVLYSDIFHEETVLLILSKETYLNYSDFSIDRITPSLIKHGYVSLSNRNPDEIKYEANSNIEKRLYIEQISNDIGSHSLISELLNSSFSYEEKPVFKFFFLYQIFELLIDSVYKSEQEKLIDELVSVKGDSGKTKDILDKVQQFISEKKRINLLVNKYTNIQSDLNDLKRLCNLLLVDLERERAEEFEGYFYKIRNFIFHQYRDFPSKGEETLNDVIQEVISLMPSILCQFKLPT